LGEVTRNPSLDELRAEVVRLGPWHIDVEITPELSTSAFLEAPPGTYPASFGRVGFQSPRKGVLRKMRRLYPDGLAGRRVLDCACNCGALLFWAKEIGASECFGFDVREHWVDQANFLREHRAKPSGGIRFEVRDLYELPELGLERFDITFFNGIFYHLPDPITGLRIAADLTGELLIVNTVTHNGYPDGMLVAGRESETQLMSGVYGLNWFPTGPEVLSRVLNWMGFPETRCHRWRRTSPDQGSELGRMEVLAGRSAEVFQAYDRPPTRLELLDRIDRIARSALPEGATVLVASGGDEELTQIEGRRTWPFPDSAGKGDGVPADAAQAISQLEELRARGAEYLLLPATAFSWLERCPEFEHHLRDRCVAVWREYGTCLILSLETEGARQAI
jgi:SAM-dependent methyltransferase